MVTIPILLWTEQLSRLKQQLHEVIWKGAGCAVVRGLPLESMDHERVLAQYLETGKLLGEILPQTVSGTTIYSVRDEGYRLDRDYGQAGVRTSKTTSAFGFHTDSPSRLAGHTPDVLGLLVLQTAKSGGASIFVDARDVFRTLEEERPDYLARLRRPFWVDRRAELPAGEEPVLAVPVFRSGGAFQVRYVRLYIEKGQELTGEPLTEFEVAALDYFDAVCARLATQVELQRGDIQFLNNTTHLHGRTAYEDFAETERKRHYLRIWMQRGEG